MVLPNVALGYQGDASSVEVELWLAAAEVASWLARRDEEAVNWRQLRRRTQESQTLWATWTCTELIQTAEGDEWDGKRVING